MRAAQPSVLARQSLRRVCQVGAVRVRAMAPTSNGKVALITGAQTLWSTFAAHLTPLQVLVRV